MMRWLSYLISGVFVCTCLAGCLEDESSTTGAQSQAVAAKPPAQAAPPPPVAVEPEVKPEEVFLYTSEGRRDPFVSLTQIRQPVDSGDEEPATPLQSFDIAQFRLVGVIVGKGLPKALVLAPDGKSYVLAKGVKIGKNNGVVINITSDAVLVKETYYDFSDNIIENILEITVPKREGV